MSREKSRAQVDDGALLLVGLGNPGPKYELTRHNIGFLLADHLAARWRIDISREKFKAKYGSGLFGNRKVTLLKPQTFMNLSGQSVGHAAEYLGIGVGGVVAFHDDIDLPFGAIRLKSGGGAGGHNGLRSLDSLLGDRSYFRVRLGVGRPARGDVRDWVLQRFDASEQAELDDWLADAAQATEVLISQGLKEAQNRYHALTRGAPGGT